MRFALEIAPNSGIENVIICGVDLYKCALGRPFAIRSFGGIVPGVAGCSKLVDWRSPHLWLNATLSRIGLPPSVFPSANVSLGL